MSRSRPAAIGTQCNATAEGLGTQADFILRVVGVHENRALVLAISGGEHSAVGAEGGPLRVAVCRRYKQCSRRAEHHAGCKLLGVGAERPALQAGFSRVSQQVAFRKEE